MVILCSIIKYFYPHIEGRLGIPNGLGVKVPGNFWGKRQETVQLNKDPNGTALWLLVVAVIPFSSGCQHCPFLYSRLHELTGIFWRLRINSLHLKLAMKTLKCLFSLLLYFQMRPAQFFPVFHLVLFDFGYCEKRIGTIVFLINFGHQHSLE